MKSLYSMRGCGVDSLPNEEDIERIRVAWTESGASASAVKRATILSWVATAARVYERDRGYCHACNLAVPRDYYECGHIIDRCRGGSDRMSNLVVMCNVCNRLKPLHDSRSAYLDWVAVVRVQGAVQASALLS